uniref:Uncharacterized protein pdi308 n=1 Tax=Pholiota microspora TaxID=1538424 RepID=G3XKU0_PHOMI|nr:hypothetical protein [Pholiota nameko]
MHSKLFALVALFSLLRLVSAAAMPLEPSFNLEARVGRTFIGYNGFSGPERPPQASAGGELGAVFYVADAVDLARLFSHGANPSQDRICLIHVDSTQWTNVPKTWVPERILAQGGNAVNAFAPGAVVFAGHTNAGLPPQAPARVFQLGVRQAQISRLVLTSTCSPAGDFANQHQTLNYASLNTTWNIQQPAFTAGQVDAVDQSGGLWGIAKEFLMKSWVR